MPPSFAKKQFDLYQFGGKALNQGAQDRVKEMRCEYLGTFARTSLRIFMDGLAVSGVSL
jgi:hypothetical protein